MRGGSSGHELYGRARELALVRELVNAATAGQGRSLVLVGEPGVGKSRLAEAAADVGREHGAEVLVGRAVPLEIERPMAAALDALELRVTDVLGPSVATRVVLEAGATAATGFLLTERLLDALDARCAEHPVLLIVEDLQWADPATIEWCEHVAERATTTALALLATMRPPRKGSVLQRFLDRCPASLELEPLDSGDVLALAKDSLGSDPGPKLRDELDGAGGNPLLVLALLDALVAGDALTEKDGTVDVSQQSEFRRAGPVAAHVAELDEPTLRVLQVAAVLGPAFSLADLGTVLDRRALDVLPAAEAAAAAGVLVPRGDLYAFRHELHREAVLATLPDAALAPIHLDVARALAASGAPAVEVAEHYARGARPGNRQAVAWLQRAAVEIVDRAPGTALRLLDVALALSGSSASPELLLTRVRALTGAGHMAEAEALARSLFREGLDPSTQARLHRELAFAYFVQGRAAESVEQIGQYGALVQDERLRGRSLAELAFTNFVSLDHASARADAEAAVAEGRRIGDVASEIGGGAVLCMLELFSNRFDLSTDWADRICRLATQPHAVDGHLYQPWFVAGLTWNDTDDFDRLHAVVREGRAVADRRGAAWAIPGYDALTAYAALRTGEFDDAAAAAEATLAYLDGADGFGVAVWCHSFLAQVALHRGDAANAASHVATAEGWLARGRAQFGLEQCMIAKARLLERNGDPAAALSSLAGVWQLFTALQTLPARQPLGPDIVRLAVAAGQRDVVDDVVGGTATAADQTGSISFRAFALAAQAHAEQRADVALEAVALARLTPRRPMLAHMLADAATLARSSGQLLDADTLAEEAAQLFSAMGADGSAELVSASSRNRPPARRPRFGFDALTATERKVVGLIADGLSNVEIAKRLYVSRRTVESHVSAAYRKLEVSSRVELARVVLSRGA